MYSVRMAFWESEVRVRQFWEIHLWTPFFLGYSFIKLKGFVFLDCISFRVFFMKNISRVLRFLRALKFVILSWTRAGVTWFIPGTDTMWTDFILGR